MRPPAGARRALAVGLLAVALLMGCGDGGEEEIPRPGDPGTRFGYNDDLAPGAAAFDLLPGSGSDLMRRRLSWTEIESTEGVRDWSAYDALYEQFLDAGVRPLWVLVDAPCWTQAPDPSGIPCAPGPAAAPSVESAAKLGDLLATAAERYPESAGIEVGNEVNDDRFWRGGDPGSYAVLLDAAATAVEAADPEMPVVASGLIPFEEAGPGRTPWRDYLGAIVGSGVDERIDAFAFHPYVTPLRGEERIEAVERTLDEVDAFLAEAGAAELPVWVTEVGVSTYGRGGGAEAEQTEELVEIYDLLESRGTPVAVIHRLVDGSVPGFPLEAGYGVAEQDAAALKPAYCALAERRGEPCP